MLIFLRFQISLYSYFENLPSNRRKQSCGNARLKTQIKNSNAYNFCSLSLILLRFLALQYLMSVYYLWIINLTASSGCVLYILTRQSLANTFLCYIIVGIFLANHRARLFAGFASLFLCHFISSDWKKIKLLFIWNRTNSTLPVTRKSVHHLVPLKTHKIAGVSSETSNENGFKIIDIDILCGIIANFTLCSKCLANTLSLKLKELSLNREGRNVLQITASLIPPVISSMNFYTSGN